MFNWTSIEEFFLAIQGLDYVVLRNFETIYSDITDTNHPDIDILCSDRKAMLDLVQSDSRTNKTNDYIHRKILIADREVALDIRCVGDGYYDARWEENILTNRVMWNNLCYVPAEKDYFYSLLYH